MLQRGKLFPLCFQPSEILDDSARTKPASISGKALFWLMLDYPRFGFGETGIPVTSSQVFQGSTKLQESSFARPLGRPEGRGTWTLHTTRSRKTHSRWAWGRRADQGRRTESRRLTPRTGDLTWVVEMPIRQNELRRRRAFDTDTASAKTKKPLDGAFLFTASRFDYGILCIVKVP